MGIQQNIWVVGQGKCIPFPHVVISGIALKSGLLNKKNPYGSHANIVWPQNMIFIAFFLINADLLKAR